jgi:uncharacterized protein YndB with AHSA1/START domain
MEPTIVTRSGTIPATPADVWTTLASLDQISRWAPNVEHSSLLTAEATGVGAARRVQVGRGRALVETVTVWQPGTALTYSIDGLPPLVTSITNRWQLDEAAGGTRATLTTTIDPGTALRGRVGALVLSQVLARASVTMLRGLAAHHQATGPRTGTR